jgi:hypothetical protein
MNENPQIFKNPFASTFCEMFNCHNPAKWLAGRPSESALVLPGFLKLCDKCAISIVQNLPEELKQHITPPEGVVLISTDMLAELEELAKLNKELFEVSEKEKAELAAKVAELELKLTEKGGGKDESKPAAGSTEQNGKGKDPSDAQGKGTKRHDGGKRK